MKVQEEYKRILKKMIENANSDKIQSSEQLIRALIKELRGDSHKQEDTP